MSIETQGRAVSIGAEQFLRDLDLVAPHIDKANTKLNDGYSHLGKTATYTDVLRVILADAPEIVELIGHDAVKRAINEVIKEGVMSSPHIPREPSF